MKVGCDGDGQSEGYLTPNMTPHRTVSIATAAADRLFAVGSTPMIYVE